MAWYNIFGSSIVKEVGKVVDSVHTSGEEKMEHELEMYKAENSFGAVQEQEQTKRVQSDNEHAVTRLVRPMLVAYSVFMFTVIMIFDGNIGEFTIKEAYMPIVEMLLFTTVGGYFIVRTYDKHSKNKHGRKA